MWYNTIRSPYDGRTSAKWLRKHFADFDEVFEYLLGRYWRHFDVQFAFVKGGVSPRTVAAWMDDCDVKTYVPFARCFSDPRVPEPRNLASIVYAIPSMYGGIVNGKVVIDPDYHTEFYLIPRTNVR